MKRNPLYGYLSLLAACAFMWVSCGPKDVPEAPVARVEGISVSPPYLTMTEGDISSLTVAVLPENAQNKTVLWSSSKEDVAIVSDGVVVAVSPGMAMIKAESEDGGKTAICLVTVVARVVPVTAVTLNKSNLEMEVGGTVSLSATVKPDNATDKSVTWSTSDSEVATVNNGVVKALKLGTAVITATAGEKSATCSVTVVPTPVTSITLNRTSASLKLGGTLTLTATVKPDNATDKSVTWSTSDSEVATVNNGVVTALKIGTAIITAKAGEKSATCTITVKSTVSDGENEDVGFEDWND